MTRTRDEIVNEIRTALISAPGLCGVIVVTCDAVNYNVAAIGEMDSTMMDVLRAIQGAMQLQPGGAGQVTRVCQVNGRDEPDLDTALAKATTGKGLPS